MPELFRNIPAPKKLNNMHSSLQEDHKKLAKSRSIRVNFLFFLVFILFTALIIKLGMVQIVNGQAYVKEISRTQSDYSSYPAPRGIMFDRNGKIVVDNKGLSAISFTMDKSMSTSEKLDVARKLAGFIEMPTDFLKERDLKDYWLAANPEKARKLLSKKELKLEGGKTYKLQLSRISDDMLESIKSDPKEFEAAAVFAKCSSGYYYEPQIVKSGNIKGKEISLVAENLDDLPGVDIITDWSRVYPHEETLKSIFGGVTTAQQGILKDREDFYLVKDYARNDRVGKSFIEYQYEDYLKPKKMKTEYKSDNSGNVLSEKVVEQGRRGYDLQLSFDMDLQKEAEKIIEEEIRKARSASGNYTIDRAFAVVMDPHRGDILSMAGKQVNLKKPSEMLDFAYGAFTTQYEMGSTVKGATVLAGYQDGISHGQVYFDGPILLKGSKPKKSYNNFGPINDVNALKVSSNVYMFRAAMQMANIAYTPNRPFPATMKDFEKIRNYYRQFGLGVETGVDLPQESTGQMVDPDNPGKLLDLVIGQFDTYTPLQMAQYVSAIANGGYRVKPRIVTSIHQPAEEGIGPLLKEQKPVILNRINNTPDDLERVQRGFKLVTSAPGGTANGAFGKHDVAGKTGTAETYYNGPDKRYSRQFTYNLTFVGYYPSENPEIAFSVVVPWVNPNSASQINKNIASRIVDAYVRLKNPEAAAETETKKENQ